MHAMYVCMYVSLEIDLMGMMMDRYLSHYC